MLRTMESDLHGPITVPVVVRDGARSRASRAFVEADPGLTSLKCEVGQFNPYNLTCIFVTVCVVPRLTLLLWVHVCVVCGVCGGPWSVDYLVPGLTNADVTF
jgi:hypothetical protein